MSILFARASGNLTSSSTWGLVNAASYLNSTASNTNLTTAFVSSSTFTPGAVTVDGIAVRVGLRNSSPSGTMHVELRQGGVTVAGTAVSCNVSDLPVSAVAADDGGWAFFKFASPVTLVAATLYTVAARTSVASQVSLFRNATAANWSRALRTTTTQSPAAGDDMFISAEITGAGAVSPITVTMDSTAATDYGSGATGSAGVIAPAIGISAGGTLAFGTSSSTNYLLRVSGCVVVYAGGTLSIGTSGTPIPRNSTAWLEFDCPAAGNYGLVLHNLSTYSHYGLSRTSGNNSWFCLLTVDAAIAATSLTVDRATGWLDNDEIAVASTTRTRGQSEKGTLNGNAASGTLTVDGFAGAGGGLAFAHEGVAIQAEIILLTRNTGIRAVTSTFQAYVLIDGDTAIVSCSWMSFRYLGSSGVVPAVDMISKQACSFDHCSFYEGTTQFATSVVGNTGGLTITNQSHWGGSTGQPFTLGANLGVNVTVSGLIVLSTSNSAPVSLDNTGGTFSDITALGGQSSCISIASRSGTLTNITARAGGVYGISLGNGHHSSTMTNLVARRNATGFNFDTYGMLYPIDTLTMIGNSNGLNIGSGGIVFAKNVIIAGETGFSSTTAIFGGGTGVLQLDNISLGQSPYQPNTNTIQNSNASGCIYILNGVTTSDTNDLFGSGSNRSAWSTLSQASWINRNGVVGTKSYFCAGDTETDTVDFYSAAPSEKLTPRTASIKHTSSPRLVLVNVGDTKTVSVAVKKNATYNGSQPRLIVGPNGGVGSNSQLVLDTMASGTGVWEILTGVLPTATQDGALKVWVDCDGTAGYINVDEWSVS